MSGIESGFLILDSQWWNDVDTSDCARYTLFRILYSCIYHTSRSLFIYYSVLPQCDEYCHEINEISIRPLGVDGELCQQPFIKLTYKHINGIVKAYEIALDVIEILNKIPTFDIRFIPVRNDCLSHIYRTMKLNAQALFWPNSYKFCEKHGSLTQCASIINGVFSCISRENVHYINFISEDAEINSIICKEHTADLISHGFQIFKVSDSLSIPSWNKINTTIEGYYDDFFDSPINRTLFAGTFDRLHPGHKVNITVATWYAKELVIIGITDTPLNANKRDKDIIQVSFLSYTLNNIQIQFRIFPLEAQTSILSFSLYLQIFLLLY